MNLKKKAQVLLLPTDKAEGCLLKGLGTLQRFPDKYFTKEYLIETKRTSHHLYIVDDSEIKEGDWCLAVLTNTLFQVKEIDSSTREIYYLQFGILCPKRNAKKVIASTDKSLDLPSPSEQFIQKYVESYNKGIIISEVMVEWETFQNMEVYKSKTNTKRDYIDVSGNVYNDEKLKVDSKNQVTITRCKESYSKEELKQLFDSYGDNIPVKIIWEDIQNL